MIIRAQRSIDAPQPKLWSRAVCIFDWYEFLQARTSNTNFWQSRADFDLKLGWDTTSSQDEQKILRELSDSTPLKPSNIDFTCQRQKSRNQMQNNLLYCYMGKLPKPNFANKVLWELKSRSVINNALINDNPSLELDWCPTDKVMVQFGLHFCLSELSECMRAPKPNSANKALWELKSRSMINIAMISDNPSPELDWCPTAKVMVKTSLHFAGFEFWQGSSFKH